MTMKNERVKLVTISQTQDKDGFPITTRKKFDVWADVQSAKRSEFYAASEAGYEVKLVCVVNEDDFKAVKTLSTDKPTQVEYDGTMYKILRFYHKKPSHEIELTLVEGDK